MLKCWAHVINQRKVEPDEGLCIHVLHTAARHGLPQLAAEAITALKALEPNFKFQAYHLEPLFESHCVSSDVDGALKSLKMMRDEGVTISRHSLNAMGWRAYRCCKFKRLPDCEMRKMLVNLTDIYQHASQIIRRRQENIPPGCKPFRL